MLREILTLLSCGSVAYAWLCAVISPLVRALRSLAVAGSERAQRQSGATSPMGEPSREQQWLALAVAAGAALLWTAIVAAATLLAITLDPRAGLAVIRSHLFWPGVVGGAAAWLVQLSATRRMPRFGDAFDAASAEAVLGFSIARSSRPWPRAGAA